MLKKMLHTGLQVADLEQAIELYKSLGFSVVKQFEKPEPKARVVWVENNGIILELWQFIDTDHPEVKYIRNHVAISSDNLEEDIEILVKLGYKLVIPITQGVVLRYAFVQDSVGSTYEIAQVE